MFNKKRFFINVLFFSLCTSGIHFKSNAMEASSSRTVGYFTAAKEQTRDLKKTLAYFALDSLTGSISSAAIDLGLELLSNFIGTKVHTHRRDNTVPIIFNRHQSINDVVSSYNKFRTCCLDIAKADIQTLQSQLSSANLFDLLDMETKLSTFLEKTRSNTAFLQQKYNDYSKRNKTYQFRLFLANNPQEAISQALETRNISTPLLKDMLSYDALLFSSQSLVNNVETTLAHIRAQKNRIIYSEVSSFVETLPDGKSELLALKSNLTNEMAALQSNERIKNTNRMAALCDQTIQKCLDQKRLSAAEAIAQGRKSYQRTLDEHQKKILITQAKRDVVDKRIATLSQKYPEKREWCKVAIVQNQFETISPQDTTDFTRTGLSLDQVAFAKKHGLLPVHEKTMVNSQVKAIKALNLGHKENREIIVHNIKNINQLNESKSACAITCPQACELYESAITCTSAALDEYLENNNKDAILLNKCANAFWKIANATTQAAKCSYYFTKENLSTIVDNAVSIFNIPQHWTTGKEFLKFMILNNTKPDLQSMENHLAFTAACAKNTRMLSGYH